MASRGPRSPSTRPIGFAHRGARAQARDNTIEGFALALALGAEGLESDAWLSADGVAVLDHDGMIGRWRRRPVGQIRRAELPGHVPSLDDLYAQCGTAYQLSLDVKDAAAAAAVVAAADRAGAVDRLWLCHPDRGTLTSWRREHPGVRLVLSTGLGRLGGDLDSCAASLAAAGIDAINLRGPEWTADRITAVHAHGVAAFGWDAQDATTLGRLVAAGIDGVYSDHVERMVAACRPR